MMKLHYDKTADAAYIYFEYPLTDGAVDETIEVSENVYFDYDKQKKLLGVEILNASKILGKKALLEAE